jgi:hypothetical protein
MTQMQQNPTWGIWKDTIYTFSKTMMTDHLPTFNLFATAYRTASGLPPPPLAVFSLEKVSMLGLRAPTIQGWQPRFTPATVRKADTKNNATAASTTAVPAPQLPPPTATATPTQRHHTVPPPRPPAHVLPTLFHQELRHHEDAKNAFYCFLATTKREQSPSYHLHDQVDILKHIFSFVATCEKISMTDDDVSKKYRYKVKMQMCTGWAVVNVEALANNNKRGPWQQQQQQQQKKQRDGDADGDGDDRDDADAEGCAVLTSRIGMPDVPNEEHIARLAQLCNYHEQQQQQPGDDAGDGGGSTNNYYYTTTYYTEGQLRAAWRNTIGPCNGVGSAPCMVAQHEVLVATAAAMNLPVQLPDGCEFCDGMSPVPEISLVPMPPPPPEAAMVPPEYHYYYCHKLCRALPGDTIYWKLLKGQRYGGARYDQRIAYRWETATDDDLMERGHVEPGMTGQQGLLFSMCQAYRRSCRHETSSVQNGNDDDDAKQEADNSCTVS